MRISVLLLLAFGLGAAALAQTPAKARTAAGPHFCDDLKIVTADTARKFETIKGAKISESPRDSGGYATVKYRALRKLDGASVCSVEDYLRPEGNPLRSYACEWTPVGSKTATVLALAQTSETCVGSNDPLDSMTAAQGRDEATAYVYGEDFGITIGAGTAPQVLFWVRPE